MKSITHFGRAVAKRAALVALAVPLIVGTQGCTDDEMAIGLGAVAIGVGAVAIGVGSSGNGHGHHHHHRPPPRCHGGYRTVCSTHHDRWGNYYRDCRQVYDSCAHYYSALALGGTSAPAVKTVDPQVGGLVEKFNLSFEGAETLVTALNSAKQGDLSGVHGLGIANDDLMRLGRLQMISESGVQSLAERLSVSTETSRNFVSSVLAEIKTQAQDSSSPYWKSCTSAKRWKTAENNWCEKTYWQGCSPETGATLCAAAE